MRCGVYACAKDEAHNVQAWAESARDADFIALTDTGSSDDTVKIAMECEPYVHVFRASIVPWRFDMGFNVALANLPADIDIAVPLHLDERLQSGWRSELEVAWRAGARQMTFMYEWGPELTYRHDRIHARAGYRWVGAAHEYPSGPGPRMDTNVRIVQERDGSKDRSQDDALIELAWRENPTARTTWYHARQLYYRNKWDESRRLILQYLSMPDSTYGQERAEACRHMAKMVFPQLQEAWLLRACSEAPARREVWADLAVWYRDHGMPREAAGAAARALRITEQTPANSFHCELWAWRDDWLTEIVERARS